VTSPRIAVALFGPPGRGSFNESGLAGWQRARDAGHGTTLHWIEPPDGAGRIQALRVLCAQGLDLLVAHGGQGDAPVAALSAEFPDMRFAITQGHWRSPNTACYEVLQEQSAFLAGVLAGLATRTGVVGHLSGEKVRPGLKGRAAFAHGVRSAAPGCRFVTTFCGHQHDPALAYRAAQALQREGADLVFAMIDGGRDGITQACRESTMRQIGNVLDWVARDPQVFAASAIADSGRGVDRAIVDFVTGRLQPGTLTCTGLEAPQAVRLVMTADLHQAFGAEIEAWSRRLQSGAVVPDEVYDGPEMQA
jgi:basic membrane protein A